MCQTLHLAAGDDVGEPNFIRQRSDKLIAADSEGGRDTVVASAKTGKNQETAG
jgi:hypothetical protein